MAKSLPSADIGRPEVRFAEVVEHARTALMADSGQLWGIDFSAARWIGSAEDRWLLTEDPELADYPYVRPFWRGPKPVGSTQGDTAIDWAGRRWAIVGLPLDEGATRSLIHEAWHANCQQRLFPGLGCELTVPGGDLLDRAAGRVWLRLEVSALIRALAGPDERAAGEAVCFRMRRQQEATAAEWERERTLDLLEGLAEYTGWKLSNADRSAVAAFTAGISTTNSLVRSFAYHTGPAYGFLLDDAAPGWQRDISAVRDLAALLGRNAEVPDIERAEIIAGKYGYHRVLAEEQARDRDRADDLAAVARRFGDGPLLRIRPGPLRIDFSPQRVRQLDIGTVYGKLAWRTADGAVLEVDGEALVTADWKEIQVPLAVLTDRPPAEGPGWTITLTDSWQVVRDRRGWLVTPG